MICNCTLPLTNPEACLTCQNNTENMAQGLTYANYEPNYQPIGDPERNITKKITRTIEKYGPDGKYLGKEVITEEYEDIPETHVYPQGGQPYANANPTNPAASMYVNDVGNLVWADGTGNVNLNDPPTPPPQVDGRFA